MVIQGSWLKLLYNKLSELSNERAASSAYNAVDTALDNITILNHKNIKILAQLCKYAYYGNETNRIVQKVNRKAYALFQSRLWEDLIQCNFIYILDYLYITRNALRYRGITVHEKKHGLRCLTRVINGPYLLRAEWPPNSLIELYNLTQTLNISLDSPININPYTSVFVNDRSSLWKWTNLNYKTFKAYCLLISPSKSHGIDHHIKVSCLVQLASAIKLRNINEIIEILFLLAKLDIPHIQMIEQALNIVKKEQVTYSTALPLIISIEYLNFIKKSKELEHDNQ